MSDPLELEQLFGPDSNYIDEPMYDKVEFVELYDNQNGSYATGQIAFNTDSQMKHHVVYADSYLTLPIRVSSSTDGRLAVKNSILSFIHGLEISSGSGTVIVNEQSGTAIMANLRLLLDSSIDFVTGNELMYFGHDKVVEENASGANKSVIGGAHGEAPSGRGLTTDAINFLKNPRLFERITVFAKRAESTLSVAGPPRVDATHEFVAYIPLKFVHDWFAQMNFPMINMSLRITFNIAGAGSYAGVSPWTTPVFPAHSTTGSVSSPAALVGVAAAAAIADTLAPVVPSAIVTKTEILPQITDRFGGVHAPRLFLKTVYFRAAEAAALKAKIVSGFPKTINYRTVNLHQQTQVAGASSVIDWPFVQGVIRPVRVWVFPLERDSAGRKAMESTLNTFPSRIGKLALKNTNIVLNGDNFYNKPFKTQYDFYREFKTQLIGAGTAQAATTPISYSDWITGFNPYCFDLSRNATVRTNNLCTMSLVSDVVDQVTEVAAAATVDFYVLVERMMVCTIKVSEGGVEVLVKQGASE